MPDSNLNKQLMRDFEERFSRPPEAVAFAPGRVEILGNHTDYNDGFVLSAAIDMGTCFAACRADDSSCRLVAGDVLEESGFDIADPQPPTKHGWSNYVRGVVAGLRAHGELDHGFCAQFLGNVPLGAGLSSSAALEMSSGLALAALYGLHVEPIAMARIGQAAEHEFAGVKCGLLDQITSLFGRPNGLVLTDFRSLDVENVALGEDACFLMCNTNVKHSLVDSEYNSRREQCEAAVRAFASLLGRPVKALRDVSWEEWEQHKDDLDPTVSRRAAHVIGENARVVKGRELLAHGDLEGFGRLMFESHESSRTRFENSCPEIDALVDAARRVPGVMGARLSGGGFGGSAVILLNPRDAETIAHALRKAYTAETGESCDVRRITPSRGACLIGQA